jgi:hypothetical protein
MEINSLAELFAALKIGPTGKFKFEDKDFVIANEELLKSGLTDVLSHSTIEVTSTENQINS